LYRPLTISVHSGFRRPRTARYNGAIYADHPCRCEKNEHKNEQKCAGAMPVFDQTALCPDAGSRTTDATMTEEHSSPIKTPKQLIIVVLLAFIIPITIAGLVSQLVTSGEHGVKDSDDKVLSRIQPVGTVVLAEASAPKGMLTGEQVYGQVCKTCHDAGIAGAPKTGDKANWAPRLAQGENVLFQHAIAGYQGKAGVMPPKGGNPDLTDDEVKRAVAFMANKAGGTIKEPAIAPAAVAAAPAAVAPAPATTTAAAAAPAIPPPQSTVTTPATPPLASAAATKPDGKKVYDTVCMVCHGTGVAGAPKYGDKAAWAPRIATGMETLYASSLKGKGAMPPKGGNTALSDAEVRAAVDFMVAGSK
jgi:cytochrome c5